jgi:hypothetical protein
MILLDIHLLAPEVVVLKRLFPIRSQFGRRCGFLR